MERLTKEGKFCDVIECELTPGGSFCERGTCTERRLWERLSSIEDILGDDYDLDRLRDLVEADREGRCVVADAPPSPGKRYVLRAMCRYCPDNYRIGPRCFQQKKCKVKVLEETRAKEEAGFSENTGGA